MDNPDWKCPYCLVPLVSLGCPLPPDDDDGDGLEQCPYCGCGLDLGPPDDEAEAAD